jgi:hypothetical protein
MSKKKKTVIDAVVSHVVEASNVPTLITGYQYGDNGQFIGEYRFEKNRDKEEIHCPPCTTLQPPPTNLPVDEEAYFDGKQWQVRRLSLSWLPDRELPDLELPQPEEKAHDD